MKRNEREGKVVPASHLPRSFNWIDEALPVKYGALLYTRQDKNASRYYNLANTIGLNVLITKKTRGKKQKLLTDCDWRFCEQQRSLRTEPVSVVKKNRK